MLSSSSSSSPSTFATLDEPVSVTIMRDVSMVFGKLKNVLNPRADPSVIARQLHNWDLWGPLLLCLLLASSLSFTAPESQSALVFASVFVLVWCGSAVVTLNSLLLGAQLSFLQSVCVLGYCLCPLVVSSLVNHCWDNQAFQSIVLLVSLLWSVRASLSFMHPLLAAGNPLYTDRRALAVYPLALFYCIIAWMVLVQ